MRGGSMLNSLFWLMAAGLISAIPATAESRHRVTYDDLKALKSVWYGDVSPDGKWLAYEVDGRELWIVMTKPGSMPRKIGDGTFPGWSPDSEHLGYYASDDGLSQLWVYSVSSNHSEPVTEIKKGIDPDMSVSFIGTGGTSREPVQFSWAPDSTKLVFPSRVLARGGRTAPAPKGPGVRQEEQPLVFDNSTPPFATLAGIFRSGDAPLLQAGKLSHGEDEERGKDKVDQLFIVDIQTKELRQLTTDDAVYFTPDWSPDGRTIVCVSMEGRQIYF
jgi:Tol biopolymer transport system component